jgi:hypothetical protein
MHVIIEGITKRIQYRARSDGQIEVMATLAFIVTGL